MSVRLPAENTALIYIRKVLDFDFLLHFEEAYRAPVSIAYTQKSRIAKFVKRTKLRLWLEDLN